MKPIILMRGLLLFNVILFFAYPKSIAQSSVITGTVFEKEQSKTTFNTPNGTINVYLPDDIRSGDEITGTVTMQPKGSDDAQQTNNLNELLAYNLYLPNDVPISTNTIKQNEGLTHKTLSFKVPVETALAFELKTKDNESVSIAEIPTLPTVPIDQAVAEQNPGYLLAKKVISNSEPIVLLTSNANSNSPHIVLKEHNQTEPKTIALESSIYSPRKSIYNLPQGLSGIYTLSLELPDGTVEVIDLVNIVNIDASIGKGNLAKGEKTTLSMRVTGLEDCPYRPVQIELVNKTTSIIQLENGNEQLFPIDNSDNPDGFSLSEPFETSQNVIGETPGNFVINSTLRIPESAYINSVQFYLDNADDTEQLNASINALKSDINNYINDNSLDTGTSNYLSQIRNNLPIADNENDVSQVKSQVVNMLNPLLTMNMAKDFFIQMGSLKNMYPELAEHNEINQLVHPFHNLAGEFNAETNILSLNAMDKELLLNYLNAEQLPNGYYTIILNDGQQQQVYSDVVLNVDDSNMIYAVVYGNSGLELSKQQDTSVTDTETEEDTDVDEETEIILPDNVTDFEDKKGLKYKFYKDAECKRLFPDDSDGKFSECRPHYTLGKNETTGELELKPTGKYLKTNYEPINRCVKGEGFCTEMEQIVLTQMFYEDKNCKRLISVETHKDFRCDN